MEVLAKFVRIAEPINDWIGRTVAWLALATVIVCFAGVFMRYALSVGFIWVQDLYVWLHATVFIMGAGYTYLTGGHVRVDIFYARMGARGKAWVDLIGCVVWLMPWLILLFVTTLPFAQLSWRLLEPSGQPGGMPGLFLLKTQILAFSVVVGLQGLAVMARSVLILNGRVEFLPKSSGH